MKKIVDFKQKCVDIFAKWTSTEDYCLRWCISIMEIQGLWPGAKITWLTTRKVYIHFIASVAAYCSSVTFPVGIYIHWDKGINVISEQIACIFLFGTVVLYIWCFHFNSKKYEKVLECFDAMLMSSGQYSERPQAIIKETKLFSLLAVGCFMSCNFNAAMFILLQLPMLRKRNEFAFKGWFPKVITNPPLYDPILVASTLFEIAGQLVITTGLFFLILLLVQVIGQFKLLNYNLAIALPSSYHIDNTPEETFGEKTPTRMTFRQEERYGQLNVCIKHHQEILRFVQVVEDSFQGVLGFQCFSCLVPVVMAITLVTYAHEYDLKVYMFITITVVTTLYLGLFCLLADVIATQSSLVAESVYASNWLGVSSGCRQSLLIIMARANRPVTLTVAGFLPLTNEQFVDILRLTYSYFLSIRTYLIGHVP